jgi:uncharacterized membrane protein HdeD (DUF308 family)
MSMTASALPTNRINLPWWILLVTGIGWLVFAWLVLSFDFTTVWAVAVWAGCGIIAAGLMQFAAGTLLEGFWRWLSYGLAVAAVVVGFMCLIWPGETFVVLAALIGWYLMFKGVFDIVMALATKDVYDLWWLTLIVGIVEVLVGFWAIGYNGRSIALLVIWVGAAALARGVTDLFLAFQLKKLQDDLA